MYLIDLFLWFLAICFIITFMNLIKAIPNENKQLIIITYEVYEC